MTTIDWRKMAAEAEFCVQHFIEGDYVICSKNNDTKKYSPRDGSLLYQLPDISPDQIDQAVKGARRAFKDKRWRAMTLQQRQTILLKLADLIDIHRETFALYESLDAGKPITQALEEVSTAAVMLRQIVHDADKLFSPYIADGSYSAYQLRKPIGVIAAITAWNYPLVIAVLKIAPALIMGNSLVLKPSEYASLSANYLGLLAIEAGLPPGVLNIIHCSGVTMGNILSHHEDIDLVSFTGSSQVGKQLQIAAGRSNMKRLLLECGGKSPYIVFDDCPSDLDMLAADIVGIAFSNQSQNCVAASRLILQAGVKDKLLPKVIELVKNITPEDPLLINTKFGALIHKAHMNKVLSFIDSGETEGAKLVCGGKQIQVDTGKGNNDGFYIEPTVFDHVNPNQKIALEEIFGPVLSVLTFKNEQEAIELANASGFGLAAYIATENVGRIQRLVHEVNSGFTQINGTSSPTPCYIELGREGQRESGFGHEGGLNGLFSYTVSTSVHQWA